MVKGQIPLIAVIFIIIILLAIVFNPFKPKHAGKINYEWIGDNNIKSGEAARLKVWGDNRGSKDALDLKLNFIPESEDYIKIEYNGNEIKHLDLGVVNPDEETATRILDILGETDVTQTTVKITLNLYHQKELLDTNEIYLEISK